VPVFFLEVDFFPFPPGTILKVKRWREREPRLFLEKVFSAAKELNREAIDRTRFPPPPWEGPSFLSPFLSFLPPCRPCLMTNTSPYEYIFF